MTSTMESGLSGRSALLAPEPTTYEIEDHWITVEGARMRYLRSGVGPPLVLLHGLLGYSFSWRYAMPAFARFADVHAVDMLGMGFSDRPLGVDCDLRASARRLLHFLDLVEVDSFDLLGTSHGGAVAMMAASLAPDRIRSLILVAPVNPWTPHGKWIGPFLSAPAIAPITLSVAPRIGLTYGPLLRNLYGDARRIRKGTLEGYVAPFLIPGAFEHPLRILSTWNDDLDALRTALPRIANLPTLLMWGSKDRAVAPSSVKRLARELHNCRTLELEGVGHLPYEEVPDQFNVAVEDYLRGVALNSTHSKLIR